MLYLSHPVLHGTHGGTKNARLPRFKVLTTFVIMHNGKEKLFPRILTEPTSSFVYTCDLLFRGFAVIGCYEFKR